MDQIIEDDKKIYDLTDIYEEKNGRNNQEVIVIDGRGYERIVKDNDGHNLVDVIEDRKTADEVKDEIIKQATAIAEKIARDIIPQIAERVIREEIEKLKKISDTGSPTIN